VTERLQEEAAKVLEAEAQELERAQCEGTHRLAARQSDADAVDVEPYATFIIRTSSLRRRLLGPGAPCFPNFLTGLAVNAKSVPGQSVRTQHYRDPQSWLQERV